MDQTDQCYLTAIIHETLISNLTEVVTEKLVCRILQVAQLSQRDRAAVWVSDGQKWKTVTRRQYFTDTVSNWRMASLSN